MIKTISKYSLVALVLYCIFLLATVPAQLVVAKVELPKNVQLGMVTGTVWQGSIDSAKVDGVLIKNIKWNVAFSRLLTGKFAVDFVFGSKRRMLEPYGNGIAYAGFAGVGIEDTKVSFPADLVKAKLRNAMVESVQGLVKLDITEATLGEPYCTILQADAAWQQPAVNVMGGEFAVGDLAAKLSCDNGNVKSTIKGDEKTLILEADVLLAAKNKVSVEGFVKAGSQADTGLITALGFIGRADSQGRYKLQYPK